jgi:hypothetical protein
VFEPRLERDRADALLAGFDAAADALIALAR